VADIYWRAIFARVFGYGRLFPTCAAAQPEHRGRDARSGILALCRFLEERLRDLSDGIRLAGRNLVSEMFEQRFLVERLAGLGILYNPRDVLDRNAEAGHRLDVLPLLGGGGEGFSHSTAGTAVSKK
jgi:hypothetical protein